MRREGQTWFRFWAVPLATCVALSGMPSAVIAGEADAREGAAAVETALVAAATSGSTDSKAATSGTSVSVADKKPEISFPDHSGFVARDDVVTIVLTQEIPKDATSIRMWCDVPSVFDVVSSSGESSVTSGGQSVGSVSVAGQHVEATITGDDAKNLQGKTVAMSWKVKLVASADLSSYAVSNVASIPITGSTRFNDDSARTYHDTENLKYPGVSPSTSGGSTGTTTQTATTSPSSTTRTSTSTTTTTRTTAVPQTGDETFSPLWLVVAAAAAVLVAVVLRVRNRKG